jgi:hypothetical protein
MGETELRAANETELTEGERAALMGLLEGVLDHQSAAILRTLFDDASVYADVRVAVLATVVAALAHQEAGE